MARVNAPNLDNAPDAPGKLVPGEYDVSVSTCELVYSKNTPDRPGIKLELKIDNGPDLDNGTPAESFPYPVRDWVWGPSSEKDDEKQTERRLGDWKRVCKAFDVYYDENGFETDDFLTMTARVVIGPQPDNPRFSKVEEYKLRD